MYKIINEIDYFLDRITMYKLLLYYLVALVGIAAIFGFLGILPISSEAILISSLFIIIISWVTNKIFSAVFKIPSNSESTHITALILILIITPVQSFHGLVFLGWAAVLAVSSKYIFAVRKKHIFNPAAIAVVVTSFALRESASWWIGTVSMAPFIFLGGILIVRKIQRSSLVLSFFTSAIAVAIFFILTSGGSIISTLPRIILDSALLFLGFVMLTEPATTPPTENLQILYGLIVGILFAPQIHFGSVYSTPELALVAGNIFSYLVSSKQKLVLSLKQKIQIAPDIIDFLFVSNEKLAFLPGQYLEWTLPHKKIDIRGNRRYFTLASSTTEQAIRIGVKFYPNGSSFKNSLGTLDENKTIVAGQLAGNFVLPKNPNQKCVFIAGGIGITPYRSMIKSLLDTQESRPITLFYTDKNFSEIIYKDVFDEAQSRFGIKTVYVLTNKENLPSNWQGRVGRINEQMIREEVPDYQERIFYLSGPHLMVKEFEETLLNMGISRSKIKTDFFPGYV